MNVVLSNDNAAGARRAPNTPCSARAHTSDPRDCAELTIATRRADGSLRPDRIVWAVEHDGALYSPLGKGFLTGSVTGALSEDDWRNAFPRFTPDMIAQSQGLVDLLGRIATRRSATPGQVALAWILAGNPWAVPIPGTRRVERLQENGGADLALTKEDLAEIQEAAGAFQLTGDRYTPAMQKLIDR